MSIKTEILTLQHIRVISAEKMADFKALIKKAKDSDLIDSEQLAGCQSALENVEAIYNEATHELLHNAEYRRTYPALCAIGMADDEKSALLGNVVETAADPEFEHGLAEADILNQMEKLRQTGSYDNWSTERLRARAIELLEDDIPF